MSSKIIIGTQWGDEGKAKMIDYYSSDADIIARYQGGANAGHTVVVEGEKHVFHLIPAVIRGIEGLFNKGNGVVVDPDKLIEEIILLESKGIDVSDRIIISDSVHLIMPYHKELDGAMEELRSNKIGTTKRGIGDCYSDKCQRIGIRAGDIFNKDVLLERLEFVLKVKNLQLEKMFEKPPIAMEDILEIIDRFKEKLGHMIKNTQPFLHEALDNKKNILLEGAQGFALDIDHGTYPYVTSSNPTVGGALLGSGLNTFDIKEVIGITKAYVTRVGEGPFPTEDMADVGDRLRVNGNEFGSTTGRPRRCGWFDAPLLRQTAKVNGLTSIALTKIDVLSGFDKIKVAVDYKLKGKVVDHFPSAELEDVEPVYKELDGWAEDISHCKSFDELPDATKKFMKFIEKTAGVPISIVSVGPGRESTFVLK